MTEWDRDAFEDALIDDLRANGGRPSQGPLAGQTLMVLYSTGAASGERRRSILTYSRDGDDYVVAGTAGGSKADPKWIANLRKTPRAEIEIGRETLPIDATVITDGPERDRLWTQHVALLPNFAVYPEQTGRTIPMARLSRAE